MHKLLVLFAIGLNCISWLGTFESARTNLRNQRPEIKALLEKMAAAAAAKEEQKAIQNLTADEPSNTSRLPASEPGAESLLSDRPIIVGEMRRSYNDEELNYYFVIMSWKTPQDDIEPNQWKSEVLVINREIGYQVGYYKSKPFIGKGYIIFELQLGDRATHLFGNNGDVPSVDIKQMAVTIGKDGVMKVAATDGYDAKWVTKSSTLTLAEYERWVGHFEVSFPNGKKTPLQMFKGERGLIGEATYTESGDVCKLKFRAFPLAKDQIFLVSGYVGGLCYNSFSIQIREPSSGTLLSGGIWDRNIGEGQEPFKFQTQKQ